MQRLLTQIKEPRDKDGETTTPLVDIAELAERFRVARPLEGPALAIEIATGGPCLVSGDRDQLQAIMGNLIRNALDAVDHAGHVEVRLSTDGENAQLEVTDDGPGMSEAFVYERLHHPFQSTKSTGYGLGLYECREVARSLGGNLVIESEIGRGTMARLYLPIVEPRPNRSDGAANAN